MAKKPNMEIIFKTLVKRHLEAKILRELKRNGYSTSYTKHGKFNKITEELVKKLKP